MSYCYISLFVNIFIFYRYYRLTPNRFLGCSLVQICSNFHGARNSNLIKPFFKRIKSTGNTATLLFDSTVQLFVSCCQLSPSGRRATLQVRPHGGNATDHLLLALRSGPACITRRCSAIIRAHLQHQHLHLLTEQDDDFESARNVKKIFFFFVIQAWDYLKAPFLWPLTRRRLVDAAFPRRHYKFRLQVSLSLL